jgi:hypothetical protein
MYIGSSLFRRNPLLPSSVYKSFLNFSSDGSDASFGKVIGCLPNCTVSNPKKNDVYSYCYETPTFLVRIGGCSKSKILLLRHANRSVLLPQTEGCQDGDEAVL